MLSCYLGQNHIDWWVVLLGFHILGKDLTSGRVIHTCVIFHQKKYITFPVAKYSKKEKKEESEGGDEGAGEGGEEAGVKDERIAEPAGQVWCYLRHHRR